MKRRCEGTRRVKEADIVGRVYNVGKGLRVGIIENNDCQIVMDVERF